MNVDNFFCCKVKISLLGIVACMTVSTTVVAELSAPTYYAHFITCQAITPPAPSIDINGITVRPNGFIPIGRGTLLAIDAGNNGSIDELCVLATNNDADIVFGYAFPAGYVSGGATTGSVTITDSDLTSGNDGGNDGGNGPCGSTGCDPFPL